ncbi:MAG: PIN domain-containing protein [Ignavibacteria bacterium]|nr:PIN domain-containing protein [Ignavibacteria bacterium]
MKQLLIDTDILIDHLTTSEKESILVKLMKKYDCFTTVINAIEVYEFAGIENKIYADMMLYSFKVLGIHSRYAEKVADIINTNKSQKRNWNLRDAIIVMMAIQNKLVLATFNDEKYLNYNNVKLFKVNK